MSAFIRVATRGELPTGGKKLVEIDGRAIAVFNIDDVFYAIDDVCTHDGGPLAEGELIGCEIECPRHGARFDVRTGRPLCMPAIEPVDRSLGRVARRRYLRRDRRLTIVRAASVFSKFELAVSPAGIWRESIRPQGLNND